MAGGREKHQLQVPGCRGVSKVAAGAGITLAAALIWLAVATYKRSIFLDMIIYIEREA